MKEIAMQNVGFVLLFFVWKINLIIVDNVKKTFFKFVACYRLPIILAN